MLHLAERRQKKQMEKDGISGNRFVSENNARNNNGFTSSPQLLVALLLTARTRKQWNGPQQQAAKLQTVLNHRFQTDSFPSQNGAATQDIHPKRRHKKS